MKKYFLFGQLVRIGDIGLFKIAEHSLNTKYKKIQLTVDTKKIYNTK